MPGLTPFSPTYRAARTEFLAATHEAGARVASHLHPLTGPGGEELAVDVAELGAPDAGDVVLVVSATHGVEGFCGSALQQNWLRNRSDDLPDNVRLIMIHGLNPYGFAWVRRVNEDNVDLNRNFLDWQEAALENPRYDEIADLVVPHSWSDDEQTRTTMALVEIMERIGLTELQSIISRGQYSQPNGVFYGGSGPVWSNQWLHDWCSAELSACQRLTIIDIHTGLGAEGDAELICVPPEGTPAYERAANLWGNVTSMFGGQSTSAVLDGDWLSRTDQLVPNAETTAIALEYGTVDPVSVLQALRADAWLHTRGDPSGPEAQQVQAQVRAAFLIDSPAYLTTVWDRFVDVLERALRQ